MDFAEDIARRAQWAIRYNDHHPNPAWSTGEKLAVALVLGDDAYLAAEGYTKTQALTRLAGDIGGTNVGAWLAYVRGTLWAWMTGLNFTVITFGAGEGPGAG